MAQFERDVELEARLLDVVIAEERERPRSVQRLVGPSQLGGCRELLRSIWFEPAEDDAPEDHWPLAAHIGTVMGEELERIFGKRMDALTQQRVTTHLKDLGMEVSGASDVIFLQEQILVDLKSTAAMGDVLYQGPKLGYLIQVSVYTIGLVQAGIFEPGATARIVYYDRTGNHQGFVAIMVTWEMILNFYALAQQRVKEVVEAQKLFEQTGDPAAIHSLRDYTPSFCFSAKVECPRRFQCWGGSKWAPVEILTDVELLRAAKSYIEGRNLENMGKAMKAQARGELEGVEGRFREGPMISWPAGRINVVDAGPMETEFGELVTHEQMTREEPDGAQ